MKLDLGELDRQAHSEDRRERDRQREPGWTRRDQLALQGRRRFQASVVDGLNELAGAGVLQPPVKTDGAT